MPVGKNTATDTKFSLDEKSFQTPTEGRGLHCNAFIANSRIKPSALSNSRSAFLNLDSCENLFESPTARALRSLNSWNTQIDIKRKLTVLRGIMCRLECVFLHCVEETPELSSATT